MRLEKGKYYSTRNGQKRGPMRFREKFPHVDGKYQWTDTPEGFNPSIQDTWRSDGRWSVEEHDLDLVSEWVDDSPNTNPFHSPVRVVTRHVIDPGTYGRVLVSGVVNASDRPRSVSVTLVDVAGFPPSDNWRVYLTAAELRATAATLIELAVALEEGASS